MVIIRQSLLGICPDTVRGRLTGGRGQNRQKVLITSVSSSTFWALCTSCSNTADRERKSINIHYDTVWLLSVTFMRNRKRRVKQWLWRQKQNAQAGPSTINWVGPTADHRLGAWGSDGGVLAWRHQNRSGKLTFPEGHLRLMPWRTNHAGGNLFLPQTP